jgi:hypothetical protein
MAKSLFKFLAGPTLGPMPDTLQGSCQFEKVVVFQWMLASNWRDLRRRLVETTNLSV